MCVGVIATEKLAHVLVGQTIGLHCGFSMERRDVLLDMALARVWIAAKRCTGRQERRGSIDHCIVQDGGAKSLAGGGFGFLLIVLLVELLLTGLSGQFLETPPGFSRKPTADEADGDLCAQVSAGGKSDGLDHLEWTSAVR